MFGNVRFLVGFIFVVLGATFIATTAVFMWEFQQLGWSYQLSLLTLYSHLFLFFPTFGIVALFAFYEPTVALADMYLKKGGFEEQAKFLAVFVIILGGSYFMASQIANGTVPTLFGVPPQVLKADVSVPAKCGQRADGVCKRNDVLSTLLSVRAESNNRIGMTKFSRACVLDERLEKPDSYFKLRYCFITRKKMNAPDCCAAQKKFTMALTKMVQPPSGLSISNRAHEILLPFKVFFLFTLLAVGITLAARGKAVTDNYTDMLPQIEKGLLVGAIAMMFWPIMNHAFLHSNGVIYGAEAQTFFAMAAPVFSAVFGIWALALLFFAFRYREGKQLESTGRIFSVIGGALAIFKYNVIVDVIVRIIGSGASLATICLVALACLGAIYYVRLKSGVIPVVSPSLSPNRATAES